MAFSDCIDEIFRASAGALTRDDIEEMLPEIERRFARRQRQNPLESPQESAGVVGTELSQEAKVSAIIQKRTIAINILRRQGIRSAIEPHSDKMLALDALTVGSSGSWRDRGAVGRSAIAGRGVHQRSVQRHGALAAPMFSQLERKGLVMLFKDRDFTDQVATEIWRLSEPDNPRLPPATRPEAVEAARIIGQTVEMSRILQNKAGAWISKLPGYVLRSDWDMMAVRRHAIEEFTDDIRNNIDAEKSFDDPTDAAAVNATIVGWYKSLSSGVHEKARGAGDDPLFGFKGPGSRAKSASQHREMHWLGPDQMMAMRDKYGGGLGFLESVDKGLERAARNTALMEVFGTNPEAMFRDTLDWIGSTARDSGNFSDADHARSSWTSKAKFSMVDGSANLGGNPKLASVVGFVHGWQSLSHLGTILASAVTDTPFAAGTMRQSGINYFDGVTRQWMSVLQGRTPAEQSQILTHLHVMLDATVGDFGARFATPDGPRGWMAKTLKTFFKYNGISWWTDRMRSGVGLSLSENLASLAPRSFADLPERLRVNLGRYGITEREWSLVQKIELEEARGFKYLTADGADRLSDDVVREWLGDPDASTAALQAARDQITSKLGTYFTDQVDEAINQPGAYERLMTTGAQPAGTLIGAAIRAFMQFKGFGISVARRHFGRELFRQQSVDKAGLALLILGTTTMGYVAMQTKLLLAGKNPRTPDNVIDIAALAGAAFTQGGGAGIYGDFLMGNYDQYSKGPLEVMAGPSFGTATDLMRLASMALSKETARKIDEGKPLTDVEAQALRLARSNLPFQNFIWTKAALDYMIFYRLQEAVNPGYLRRMEMRTQRDQGTTFWLRPSAVAG